MNEFKEALGCMSYANNIGGFQCQRKDSKHTKLQFYGMNWARGLIHTKIK